MKMDFCESEYPTCPVKAPIQYGKHLLPITCNDTKVGERSVTWFFKYKLCSQGNTARWTDANGNYNCECIQNLIGDCNADMYDNKACENVFKGICTFQIVIVLIAIVLNAFICIGFRQNILMRKKNSNILLFNQAVVDLVNCTIYALPNAMFLLIQNVLHDEARFMHPTANTTLFLSASSSVFLFTLIAVERFLSIYKPIWHLTNVTPSQIWRVMVLIWILSILLSSIVPIVLLIPDEADSDQRYLIYRFAVSVLLGALFIFITTLHLWSFVVAYRALNEKDEASEQFFHQSKKQFRLLLLFIVMYIAFVIAFITLKVSALADVMYYSAQNQLLFCFYILSSLLNPTITLCLKPSFRPKFF